MWRSKTILLVLLLGVICVVNAFFLLGSTPIVPWDEARHGVSAYEMLASQSWIVNTYRGEADYWNLKPPLSFWSTMIGYKLFGTNLLGFRATSAFFGVLTIAITVAFAWRTFSSRVGLLSGFFLVTAYSFVVTHNMRHGDPDSLYILLTTGAVFATMLSVQSIRLLFFSALLLSLAFMAKSFHVGAFVIVVACIAFSLHRFGLFSPRIMGGCLLCGLLPVIAWAGLRYSYDGWDFLGKMFIVDVWNRATTIIEGHQHPASYYAKILFKEFGIVLTVCLSIFIIGFTTQCVKTTHFLFKAWKQTNVRFITYLILCTIIPFIIFQCSASKLKWYIYPIEPFIAILMAILAENTYILLKNIKIYPYLPIGFICILCGILCFQEARIVRKCIQEAHAVNFPQHTIASIDKRIQGVPIYLEKQVWQQDAVLAALLYGDFRPVDGGRSAWEKDLSGHALLISSDGALWQQKQQEPLLSEERSEQGH